MESFSDQVDWAEECQVAADARAATGSQESGYAAHRFYADLKRDIITALSASSSELPQELPWWTAAQNGTLLGTNVADQPAIDESGPVSNGQSDIGPSQPSSELSNAGYIPENEDMDDWSIPLPAGVTTDDFDMPEAGEPFPAVNMGMMAPQPPMQASGSVPMHGNLDDAAIPQQRQAQTFSGPPPAVMPPQQPIQASGSVPTYGNVNNAANYQQQQPQTFSGPLPAAIAPQLLMQAGGFDPPQGNFNYAAIQQQQQQPQAQTFPGHHQVAVPIPLLSTPENGLSEFDTAVSALSGALLNRRTPRPRSLHLPAEGMITPPPTVRAAPRQQTRRSSATAPRRPGQTTGLPQALKSHKRICTVPQEGCRANCPLLRDFPADHQRLATTPLRPTGTRMPPRGRDPGNINDDVPDGYRFKLWAHFSPPPK